MLLKAYESKTLRLIVQHLKQYPKGEEDSIDFPMNVEDFCRDNDLVIESLLHFVCMAAKHDELKDAAQDVLDEVNQILNEEH